MIHGTISYVAYHGISNAVSSLSHEVVGCALWHISVSTNLRLLVAFPETQIWKKLIQPQMRFNLIEAATSVGAFGNLRSAC
jgi:hypothetical protein